MQTLQVSTFIQCRLTACSTGPLAGGAGALSARGRLAASLGGMIRFFIAVLVFGGLVPDTTAGPAWPTPSGQPPTNESECKAAGGIWALSPMSRSPYCRLKAPDAGKVCRRASDCQSGICVMDTNGEMPAKCNNEMVRFGTYWFLDDNGQRRQIAVD